jgi:hypothetical protein
VISAAVEPSKPPPDGSSGPPVRGRFNGHAAINESTELRRITIETEPHHYPF